MNTHFRQQESVVSAEERARLAAVYERLRVRLLDLALRNPMLSYKHRAGSKRYLRFVDAVPEEVYRRLTEEGASLEVRALPLPSDIPRDELEPDFVAALEHARATDVEYLTQLQALANTGHDDELAVAKLDRDLRIRVREQLGRPTIA
jgi:hypothetical protein